MGKLIKILLVILGVFVGAVVALAIFLPMYFDPNDYKDEIAAAVKEQTGRDLTIAGDIGLSVFPWLGAEIGETRLSNAPGFGDKPMAEIADVAVRLKLMPLLQGNIEVGRISLSGLRLRLAKNAQGQTNWEDMQQAARKEEASGPRDEAEQGDAGKQGGFEVKTLQVEGVDVNDAAIYWNDASTGAVYKLEEVNLETGVIKPGDPFPLTLDFVMNQQEPPLTTQVDLTTTASVDVEKQIYGLKELVLNLTAIGEGIPGGKQSINLTADADVNMQSETASLPNLVVEAAGGRLDGSVQASQLLGDPVLKGSLKGDKLSPRDIMKTLGMEVPNTADPNVLSKASVNVQFNGKLSNLSIKPLTVVLDDTNINGSASLRQQSPLVIGFDLNVDSIDLDRYLPPSEKPKPKDAGAVGSALPAEGKAASKSGSSDINDTEIPVDVLKSLNLNGALKVKSFKIKGMHMDNVALKVESSGGVLDITPLDASLYKGNADIRARVNAAAATPAYMLKTNIRSVQSGPLLKDLMGDDRLSGLANIALDLTSTGKTVGAVRQDLDGTINVEFLEGKIKGFNLVQMIRAAKARLTGAPPPPEQPQETDFAVLAMSGVINNGVMTSNDLNFKSPFLRVGGEGQVNLASEVIDYLAKVSIVGSSTGMGGKELEDLKGLTIPIRLKGSLTSPSWKIELDEALKEKAKARLEEEKAKAQAELDAKKEEARQEYEQKKEEKKDELKRKLFDKLTGGDKE